MSVAAIPPRSVTLALTPMPSGTRSRSRSSRAKTGAGAMSTKPTHKRSGGAQGPGSATAVGVPYPLAETPDTYGAYPRLGGAQIEALAALGQRLGVQADQVLFLEGKRNCDFFVVLAGTVAVVEGRGTPEERVISVHGHGRFLGELSLLTGEASFYAAVAAETCEGLAGAGDRLRGQ